MLKMHQILGEQKIDLVLHRAHCNRDFPVYRTAKETGERLFAMSADVYSETLKICQRHADRLQWAMKEMEAQLPFTAGSLNRLTDMVVVVPDQFSTRFAKLQDIMGVKLFPAVLELTKEQGELDAFVDKLNRLVKIDAMVKL